MLSSIRVRLLIVWAIFIAITLQIAGVGLRLLFEHSITRRTQGELEADLRQLRRGMAIDGTTITIARAPTDPQFYMPDSGRYWQIDEAGKTILRSRSLGEASLKLSDTAKPGTFWLRGPKNERLFAIVRLHESAGGDGAAPRNLVITTAVDSAEISEDTSKFSSELFKSLSVLAALLLLGAWAHVTIGLGPLRAISEKLAAVRAGRAQRLDGQFPDEIMPLVNETNELLSLKEEDLKAARARAGDLAHGLKTPLAVMAANARTLRRQGNAAIADEIDKQIETMHRHVERELARARARGSQRLGLLAIDVSPLLSELISVIESLPRDNDLSWSSAIPEKLSFAVDADDFNNMAGNLIENAGKWAISRIHVTLARTPEGLLLDVEDDGPGIPPEEYERVLRRGERADRSVSGSGLGLAIVNDLVLAYSGHLQLSQSPLGGLKAGLFLPDRTASAM